VSDAPDFQEIVHIQTGGALSDAPDWQRNVTGPGGGIVQGFAGDGWVPQTYGIGAWTFPPYVPQVNSAALTRGTLFLTLLPIGATCTVSQVEVLVTTAQATPTTNENFIGIYELDYAVGTQYNLRASTAAGIMDTGFSAANHNLYTFSSSVTLTAGNVYWIAVLCNGSSNSLTLPVSTAATALPGSPEDNWFTNYTVGATTFLQQFYSLRFLTAQTSLPNPLAPTFGLTPLVGPMFFTVQ